jgi:hypothetical protein
MAQTSIHHYWKKPQRFKNLKNLPITYYATLEVWMTLDVFRDFLQALHASFGALGTKIVLFEIFLLLILKMHPFKERKGGFLPPQTAPVLYSLLIWV